MFVNFISLPRKFKFLLVVSPLLLTACQFSYDGINGDVTALGPEGCEHLHHIKKLKKTSLEAQSICFDRSINDLHEHGLLLAKAEWLKRTHGVSASTDYQLDVIDHGYAKPAIHAQLAKNYFKTGHSPNTIWPNLTAKYMALKCLVGLPFWSTRRTS